YLRPQPPRWEKLFYRRPGSCCGFFGTERSFGLSVHLQEEPFIDGPGLTLLRARVVLIWITWFLQERPCQHLKLPRMLEGGVDIRPEPKKRKGGGENPRCLHDTLHRFSAAKKYAAEAALAKLCTK